MPVSLRGRAVRHIAERWLSEALLRFASVCAATDPQWLSDTGELREMLLILAFAASFGLYLLFAGEASGTEIAAGLPAAAVVAAFAWLLHRGQTERIRLRAPWAQVLLKPLVALVKDSIRVGGVLLRAIIRPKTVSGTIDRQPFYPGGDRATEAGCRALVTLASSFAPNGFVVDVAPSIILGDTQVLLMHRLAPTQLKTDKEWPV